MKRNGKHNYIRGKLVPGMVLKEVKSHGRIQLAIPRLQFRMVCGPRSRIQDRTIFSSRCYNRRVVEEGLHITIPILIHPTFKIFRVL